MCLYCATKKYKCTITKPPNRGNRTTVVKNAYTAFIIPSPNWAEDQISFIQEKVSTYNHSNMQSEPEVYDLTITEKETTLQNSLETTLEPDENSEDTSMGDNLEYEFHTGSL
ncbi:unnamed protein product [Rhizophagus irregularis]|nr:unnamed protein product [Rhizophagus irregularis]